ncbi:MAG TPA: putative zinc-binding metallopeptidase [Gemmataceae bacterium]|nr:putative zinc-binding metallopeptidase [Gemmataceae bacterium]
MRTFRCRCENMIFFDNSVCLRCGKETGFCPGCRAVVALLPRSEGRWSCGNPVCGVALVKCSNYSKHSTCNRCVIAEEPTALPDPVFCDCCYFNQTIPDLSVPGNAQKWYRLESAKRRLFYDLDLLGLPYRLDEADPRPKLRFDFKADVIKHCILRHLSEEERVFTGHANGCITINIREADQIERERLRVNLGEAHRTLIGHFRHEIAHYYWEVLVRERAEDTCRAIFGDHDSPTYTEALEAYYKNGAPPDWRERYVSAYATMHPWEDFAETFATYLDMVSVLDTAYHVDFIRIPPRFGDFDDMVLEYKGLGIGMNEINRSMGLLDLVPEVLVEPVRDKMRYVHDLIAAESEAALAGPSA